MNRFTASAPTLDVPALLLPRLKSRLKIIDASRDSELSGLLAVSVDLIERYTWRYLSERNVLGQFSNATPSRARQSELMLDCRCAPVFDNSLVSITHHGVDSDEVLSGYIEPVGEFGECYFTSEPEQYPAERLYTIDVVFKAGYPMDGEVWTCPEPLQEAVVALAAYMFANPLDCDAGGCGCGGSSNGIRLPSNVSTLIGMCVIRRYDNAMYL